MRLKVEQVLAMFRPVKENFAHNDSGAELTITTDTIVPSTPQKVEAVVDVGSSTLISDSVTVQEKQNVASSQGLKDSTDVKVTSDSPIKIDSLKVETPKVKKDTLLPQASQVDTAKVSSVITRAKVDTVKNVQESRLVTPILSASEVVLPADTASFPIVMESFSVDSLAMTSAIAPTKTFSLEGHKKGIDHPIKLDRSDGIFALLAICFLLLAHVYNGGMAFFKENIMLVFSASKSEKLETQVTSKETVYSFFLVFLAVLLISISLYEGLDRFFPLADGDKRPFVTIGFFVVLIMLFVVAKMLLNRTIGFIFDFGKQIETWNRSYLVLFSILGLLCFFPTLMLVYSNLWHSIIIGFVLVLFLIVQIILFLRVIVFFIGQKFNLLYLIAYLCTIEILPYIFLGIGLVHLYKTDIFNTIL